ncbi:hypothetical protein RCL1_000082 [Eukaryota sp. TZLM3-RCL]
MYSTDLCIESIDQTGSLVSECFYVTDSIDHDISIHKEDYALFISGALQLPSIAAELTSLSVIVDSIADTLSFVEASLQRLESTQSTVPKPILKRFFKL